MNLVQTREGGTTGGDDAEVQRGEEEPQQRMRKGREGGEVGRREDASEEPVARGWPTWEREEASGRVKGFHWANDHGAWV